MSRILVLILMISTYVFASESLQDGSTDIVQRTINFLLFAGLIWYLIGEPVKNYFTSRSQAIADELKKVQDKLDKSVTLKKEALAKISKAEEFAQELAIHSKKENKIINDNIMMQCDLELETLTQQAISNKDYAQRKMVHSVVEDVLGETLTQSSSDFAKEAIANVILKKVA